MPPIHDLYHINKKYGKVNALIEVSFQLIQGRALGLAGLNGAGKTSLIRCILNFARPDSGHIHLFGLPSGNDLARQQLAYVPERFTGPAYLTTPAQPSNKAKQPIPTATPNRNAKLNFIQNRPEVRSLITICDPSKEGRTIKPSLGDEL